MQFTDATQASGIAFTHANSATSNKYLVETMGGGVALLDYDNDGRLDIFFTNGAKLDDPMPAGRQPDKSDPQYWNRLYHQNADGTFADVTEKAGLTGMPQNRYGMGVAVGDYDNDGFADLYVTNYGGNTLYRNNGDGTFTDVTDPGRRRGRRLERQRRLLRLRQRRPARSVRHALRGVDVSEQPLLRREESRATAPTAIPTTSRASTNILFHNNGDGTFTDVSAKRRPSRSRRARGWASRSPTTTTTASRTSTSPTTRCSRSCSTTSATARSRRSA